MKPGTPSSVLADIFNGGGDEPRRPRSKIKRAARASKKRAQGAWRWLRRDRKRMGVAVALVVALLWWALAGGGRGDPTVLAKGSATLRVRLGDVAGQAVLHAESFRCQPKAPIKLGARITLRTQSSGLLVIAENGAAWVFDEPSLAIEWTGLARLERGGKTREHAGRLVANKDDEGRVRLVLHTSLETYLTGVLEAEMGSRFAPDALRAQAVAARSFALTAAGRRTDKDFDVFDDDRDQVYRAVSDHPTIVDAVRETQGLVLKHGERVVRAYYSSTCGGHTRDGFERFRDVPKAPFRGVHCGSCQGSPRFRWKRDFERSKLTSLGLPARGKITIEASKRSARGDWVRFRAHGRGFDKSYPISKLLRLRAFPSPWFDSVTVDAKRVIVRGKGFGHGVGMCQYGALGRARRGEAWRAILAHYFPGTTIEKLGGG